MSSPDGKISKIGVMSAGFFYCQGTTLDKAEILYQLIKERRDSDSKPELDCIGGLERKDKNLRIVMQALFEFAVVYSSLHQMGIDPKSQHYKQVTVSNSGLISRFIKFKDHEAEQFGITQLIFEDELANENISKQTFLKRMKKSRCSWAFNEEMVRQKCLEFTQSHQEKLMGSTMETQSQKSNLLLQMRTFSTIKSQQFQGRYNTLRVPESSHLLSDVKITENKKVLGST